MNLFLKVLHRDAKEPISYTVEQFQEVMGITFFPHLRFETPKTLEGCRRKAARSKLDARQKWLGSYYSPEVRRGFVPDVTIAWVDEVVGFGVFANRDFPRYAFLGEYTGLVCKQRWFKKIKNNYCFDYTFVSGSFNSPYLIDAKGQGNHTRFINHSSRPNLESSSVLCDGVMHIILYATQDIAAGTQLAYDYGEDYWKKRDVPKVL